eukprot:1158039-Pelagomonas_calceolata.AAC.14
MSQSSATKADAPEECSNASRRATLGAMKRDGEGDREQWHQSFRHRAAKGALYLGKQPVVSVSSSDRAAKRSFCPNKHQVVSLPQSRIKQLSVSLYSKISPRLTQITVLVPNRGDLQPNCASILVPGMDPTRHFLMDLMFNVQYLRHGA